MMRPFVLLALLAATLLDARPAMAAGAASAPVSFRVVRQPCTIQKLREALSHRFSERVAIDPALAGFRVTWAYDREPPLQTLLSRLAELTGSQLVEGVGASGRRRFTLQRPLEIPQREAAWRKSSLGRSLRELMRAAEQQERGKLEASSVTPNVQAYLNLGRAPELKYLRRLTPEQMDRLMEGEMVRFPPGSVSEAELRAIMARRYPFNDPEESDEQIQKQIDRETQVTREQGLGLQIDLHRQFSFIHLLLHFGGSGANVLGRFSDPELGLPLTHTNPYRLLERQTADAPAPALSMPLQQRLTEDVLLPPGGRCEAAARELARVAHLDLASDAYLCRANSKLHVDPGQKVVLAPRGVTVAEALDQICRKFEYLWWEKDGCVFLRARSWPWDDRYEVPERFLESWTDALIRRHAIGPAEIVVMSTLTPLQLNGLANLAGSRFLPNSGLDRPGVAEFLALFRSCSLPQQLQLLGPGLTLTPEQAAATKEMLQPFSTRGGQGPVLLRLTQKLEPPTPTTPPLLTLKASLIRAWKGESSELPFAVEIPRLPDPLAPE